MSWQHAHSLEWRLQRMEAELRRQPHEDHRDAN